jgi:hypothetical protein
LFDELDMKLESSHKVINTLTTLFNRIIKDQTSLALKNTVQSMMPSILGSISQTQFEMPYHGIYHTEFARAPWITQYGMIMDLFLRNGPITTHGHSLVITSQKPMEQAHSEATVRSKSSLWHIRPTKNTAVQPFISASFIKELNPILLNTVSLSLAELNMAFNTEFSIPMAGVAKLNVSSLKLVQMNWEDDSGITLKKDMLEIHTKLFAKVHCLYTSTSSLVGKVGNITIQVNKAKIFAQLAFEAVNGTYIPVFRTASLDLIYFFIRGSFYRCYGGGFEISIPGTGRRNI